MTSNLKYDNENLKVGADMKGIKKGERQAAPHKNKDTTHGIIDQYLAQSNLFRGVHV